MDMRMLGTMWRTLRIQERYPMINKPSGLLKL